VAINLKKLAALEGKGRNLRDLVKTYIDRYNLAPKQQAVTSTRWTGNGDHRASVGLDSVLGR